MQCKILTYLRAAVGACCLVCFPACESIVGLDDFTVGPRTGDAIAGLPCATHLDCGEAAAQYRCVPEQARCAPLRSEDCAPVAGPDEDDRAIWIGTLLSTSGVHASANLARQQSAQLAVEHVNAAGGIVFDRSGSTAHPLVLVACDASRNLSRAATHLVRELGIRAIVGPDDSQDAAQIAARITIPNDTLLISPVATGSSLDDLLDDDLSWQMVPDDERRAPWLLHHLSALETTLRRQPNRAELQLGIVVRDDAQGESMRASLASLTFGSKPLTDPVNLGNRVRIDAYSPDRSDLRTLVHTLLERSPDILVLLGLSEAVTRVLTPLEERWTAANPGRPPPEYLLTDSAKVPELVQLAARRDELGARIRGVGVAPAPAADSVQAAFELAYGQRFASELTAVSGLDSTYDATLAAALAIASSRAVPTSGRILADALRRASNGDRRSELQRDQLGRVFGDLAAGEALAPIGALGPLRWNERGSPVSGAVQVWCLNRADGRTNFARSGFRANILDTPGGEFGRCGREGVQTSPAPTVPTAPNIPMMPEGKPTPSNPGQLPESPESPPMEPPAEPVDGGASAAPDAGSDAGTSTPDPPAMSTPVVPCGATSCSVNAAEYCCVTTVRGIAEDPVPEDFECRASAEGCALALHCSGDSDCGDGQVCCGTNTMTRCMAESECTSQAGTRLACESSRDCAAGQTCCAQLMPGITGYASIECSPECAIVDRALVLCETDQDCEAALVLGTCQPSRIVPNLKVCVVF